MTIILVISVTHLHYQYTGILVYLYGTFILVYWHTSTSVVYWYAVYFISVSTLYKLVLMLLPFMHSCGMVYWCIGVLVIQDGSSNQLHGNFITGKQMLASKST